MNLMNFQLDIKICSYVANYIGKNIFYLTRSVLRSKGMRRHAKVLVIALKELIWFMYYNYQEYLKNDGFELLENKYLNKYREDKAILNYLLSTLDKEFN